MLRVSTLIAAVLVASVAVAEDEAQPPEGYKAIITLLLNRVEVLERKVERSTQREAPRGKPPTIAELSPFFPSRLRAFA